MSTSSTASASRPASSYRDEWRKLRASGHSFREIGERFGFSHEAVRIVVDEEPGARGTRTANRKTQRAAEVRGWVEKHAPVQRDLVMQHFDLTSRQLSYLTDADPDFPMHLIMQHSRVKDETYTDDDVFESLRRVWSQVQEARPDAVGMAHTVFDKFRGGEDPSPARIIGRWGSWEAACAEAGVPPGLGYRSKASYESRWSDAEILDIVGVFLDEAEAESKRPTYVAYDEWQRGRGDAPSGTTLRLRARTLGATTWPEIVRAAAEARARKARV